MSEQQGILDKLAAQFWLVIVLLIIFPPLGIYLLWKGKHLSSGKRWALTSVSGLWLLLNMLDSALAPSGGDDYSSCAATFYENGCTYFRDDSCNVVARSCE